MVDNRMYDGYQAHAAHKHRTDNPYLELAMSWDEGWCQRQIEELKKADKKERPQSFRRWVGSY